MCCSHAPLVRVHRGPLVESVHRGTIVVVRKDDVLLAWGDPDAVVHYRSASKAIQALVGVTSGAADALGIDDEALAIAAGSHNAEDAQLTVVRRILEKADLDESVLQCAGHYSIDRALAFRQRKTTETPPAIWSNCSGKHALMLATAIHLGLPLDTVLDPEHAVQREIRRHVAALAGLDVAQVEVGFDNCGAPAFGVPMHAMALSLSRLVAPEGLEPGLGAACRRVTKATLDHPTMVGGTARFDTDVMEACGGGLTAKAGAEGVHVWAVANDGMAMAIKVEDGHDRGYRLPVLGILEALGLVEPEAARALRERHADPTIRSAAGREIGRLEIALDDEAWAALRSARRVS